MILKTINKSSLIKSLIFKILNKWVEKKTLQITSFLNINDKILDLGSGNCLVTQVLLKKGHDVTPIDVKDLSIVKKIKPIVYDGIRLPFNKDTFDVVLLLTVLHHSDDPKKLLIESQRISKNIVIIEDTYKNRIQKLVTQFTDLIVNLGHSKMTYQNKTETSWENLFEELKLKVLSKKRKTVLFFFQQTTYHLKDLK